MIFNSVQAVLDIIILLGLGVFLTHLKWITKDNLPLLSKLVIRIAVPCTIFNNMLSAITRDLLKSAGSMLVVPAITILSMYLIGWLLGKYVLRIQKNRQRTFALMASCPNAIFIGLPVVLALFGNAGAPAAMFFIVCQTSTFWSIGSAGIQADAQGKSEFSLVKTLKQMFSVNVIVIIAVLLMTLINFKPPVIATDITKYLGALSTPLSLLFSGNALYDIYREFGLKGLRITRDVLYVIVARFIVAPLIAYGLCQVFHITGVTAMVFVLMSSMPIMTQTVILCGTYGGDRDNAALSFFWTTVFGMFVIPLYMLLLK